MSEFSSCVRTAKADETVRMPESLFALVISALAHMLLLEVLKRELNAIADF